MTVERNCIALWRKAHWKVWWRKHSEKVGGEKDSGEKLHCTVEKSALKSFMEKSTVKSSVEKRILERICIALWRKAH